MTDAGCPTWCVGKFDTGRHGRVHYGIPDKLQSRWGQMVVLQPAAEHGEDARMVVLRLPLDRTDFVGGSYKLRDQLDDGMDAFLTPNEARVLADRLREAAEFAERVTGQ